MLKGAKALAKAAKLAEENGHEGLLDPTIKIKEENPMRSSPDSSTDPWTCPQCGQDHTCEAELSQHLFKIHQLRMVTQHSPTTRCPVCRKNVSDLSHHFALEHGTANNDNKSEDPDVQMPPVPNGAMSLTRIIPIVLPSSQASRGSRSGSSSHGDLNNITIIPMSNGNYSSGSTRSSTPSSDVNNDNPVNLSIRKSQDQQVPGLQGNSDQDSELYIAQAASQLGRKRRKQTHVPETNKDERYWARRLKNNEAAKKSRDMRIKREKVIFEENMRLERMVKELRSENDSLSTENKELHLKLGFILDENASLKSMLKNQEQD